MSHVVNKRARIDGSRMKLHLRNEIDAIRSNPKSASISLPAALCGMSRRKDMSWEYGTEVGYSKLKLKPGLWPFDLKEGFEIFETTYTPAKPDSLLHVLSCLKHANHEKLQGVVTWRGILSKIMCLPYSQRDSFEFVVWKYKGTMFFSNRETQEKIDQENSLSRDSKRFMYYGYKFEEICTRGDEDARDVDSRECYCRVYKTKLGRTSIIAAGEMDCFDENKKDIELKVTRMLEHNGHIRSFEKFKLLKFYCQSYLAGVPNILVGFRDDEGVIMKTQIFETTKIPQLIRGRETSLWDSKVCLQFLDRVLCWVDENVESVDSSVNESDIYVCRFSGTGTLSLTKEPRTEDERIDQELYDYFDYA